MLAKLKIAATAAVAICMGGLVWHVLEKDDSEVRSEPVRPVAASSFDPTPPSTDALSSGETRQRVPIISRTNAEAAGDSENENAKEGRIVFWGKIVESGATGTPVPGARVKRWSFGDFARNASPDEIVAEIKTDASPEMEQEFIRGLQALDLETTDSVVSDPGGLFVLSAEGADEFFVIRGTGWGPRYFRPVRGHETPEHALVIALKRGATLFGRVCGPNGPAANATVVVGPQVVEVEQTVFSTPYRSETQTERAGSYRIEDLPPEEDLDVRITLEGTGKAVAMHPPIRLTAGEERQIDWSLSAHATIVGRVVDQYDAPVPHVPVALLFPQRDPTVTGSPDRLLKGGPVGMPEFHEGCGQQTVCSVDGTFRFSVLSPGYVLVGVPKPEPGDAKLEVSSSGVVVEVPDEPRELHVLVEVHRGLHIRGRVVGPSGEGIKNAAVHADSTDGDYSIVECDEYGYFELGPLYPGQFQLEASAQSGSLYCSSEPLQVEAGEESVVLRLGTGGFLSGRVTGGPGLDFSQVRTTLYDAEKHEWLEAGGTSDGCFRFDDLQSGSYTVTARLGREWIGVCPEVQVLSGMVTPELLLPLEPAALLEVNLHHSDEFSGALVAVERNGQTILADFVRGGESTEIVVPAGLLQVVAKRPIYREGRMAAEVIGRRAIQIQAGARGVVRFGSGEP